MLFSYGVPNLKISSPNHSEFLFNRNDIEKNKNAIGDNSALLHEESLNGSYLCLRRQGTPSSKIPLATTE